MIWIVLAVVLVLVMVACREFLAIWLPWFVAINSSATGRKEPAARLFERAISRPTLFSRFIQHDARYRLAWLRMDAGRYDDAVELLRASLRTRFKPEAEANYRQRLSEALEGAGLPDEAEAERHRVTELLGASGDSAEALLVQAKTLGQMQKYGEAYAVLKRALEKLPPANTEVRSQTMIQTALAAFNAGKAEETVHWSEQALAVQGADHTVQTVGHGVCSLGLLNLGRLDEAEVHRRKALELARGVGSPDQTARYLVQVAEVVRRRGRINEALRMCQEARELSVSERRHVYAAEQACLAEKGHFKEAHELFAAMRRAKKYANPSEQRRIEAAQDGFEVQLLLELGMAEAAMPLNTSALERLAQDSKLSLQFQCDRAWLLAELGRHEEALGQATLAVKRMAEMDIGRGSQITCLHSLGRAYLALQDWVRAIEAWSRFLDLQPDPVDLPKGHYFLAQSLRGLGRCKEAAGHLKSAAEASTELYYPRLAARELDASGTAS